MKLIENWHRAWKWMSVRCMALAAAIQGAWMFIPDDMRRSIPHHIVEGATVVLLLAGVVGRVTTSIPKDTPDA